MASTTSVVACPSRFYLLADNEKFVSRSEQSQNPDYNKYCVQCIDDTADAPETVFEVMSSSPNFTDKVIWKHVESDELVSLATLLWIFPESEGMPWETYLRLDAVDVENSKAAIYVTLNDPTGVYGNYTPAYLVRQTVSPDSGSTLPDGLMPTGKTISDATIFTVYDSALEKVWTEVVYDVTNAKVENVAPFETAADILDNSNYDQTVVFDPSLTYSQSIQSSWSSSSSFGFSESISVTAEIPFVDSLDVGFTAEQSFEVGTGGSSEINTENSVTVEVPVPAGRIVQVYVVGTTGTVSIPFQYKEIATYSDGSTMERVLQDGVCSSVSSNGTTWTVKYVDDGTVLLSGAFLKP